METPSKVLFIDGVTITYHSRKSALDALENGHKVHGRALMLSSVSDISLKNEDGKIKEDKNLKYFEQ